MKKNLKFMKYAFACILLFATAEIYGQFVNDTVIAQPTVNQVAIQPQQVNEPLIDDGKYYQWETPVLEKVDLKSIEMYKSDSERYLQNIEILENVVKKDRKELNSFYQQAKDQATVLKNEQKNLKEKRNFYKQDEKLSNREKKLRDRELKLIQKERKALRKQSKDLSSYDVDNKMRQFDDREYRIESAESRWDEKRVVTQLSLEKLAEDEKVLSQRDYEIKERLRELDFYKRDLDLQSKQLAVEKKQAKLEIKKAKAALKQQSKQ